MSHEKEHKHNELAKFFTKFGNLMERNINGVQIGCYSVAFIGLTIALRKVRPFSRFKRPSDVPNHFIKERRELQGIVERIEPTGAHLMINHQPLVVLPGIKQGELPVRVTGVEVNGHGISWLQTLVAGNKVTFIPVNRMSNCVECEIKMQQTLSNNKTRVIDIGESLVYIGFAKIIEKPINKKDSNYYYYMKLRGAEEMALKKKMGIRYYIKPTKFLFTVVGSQLSALVRTLVQKALKRVEVKPKLVAA